MQKITKLFENVQVKNIDKEGKRITAVVSTSQIDRDGDMIPPESFEKWLQTYKDHPVFLSSHSYRSLLSQIGKAVEIKVMGDGIEVVFEYFTDKGNQEADWAWVLAQQGMAAFSVGFIGHKWEDLRENDMLVGRKFTEIELVEISQVLIPSNRGSLQSARRELEAVGALVAKALDMMKAGTLAGVDVTEPEINDAEHTEGRSYIEDVLGGGAKEPEGQPIEDGQVGDAIVRGVQEQLITEVLKHGIERNPLGR